MSLIPDRKSALDHISNYCIYIGEDYKNRSRHYYYFGPCDADNDEHIQPWGRIAKKHVTSTGYFLKKYIDDLR
jgi:hypothetical protein